MKVPPSHGVSRVRRAPEPIESLSVRSRTSQSTVKLAALREPADRCETTNGLERLTAQRVTHFEKSSRGVTDVTAQQKKEYKSTSRNKSVNRQPGQDTREQTTKRTHERRHEGTQVVSALCDCVVSISRVCPVPG